MVLHILIFQGSFSWRVDLFFVLFVIEVAGNVLFYTDMNTHGKRTDTVFAVCVIYGEKVFFIQTKCMKLPKASTVFLISARISVRMQ